MSKLDEILESGQFPVVSIRQPVRSAVIRDRAGRSSRVVYAGGEDTKSVEKLQMDAAELDGVDLSTATMTVVEERGQGIGKRQDQTARQVARSRRPKTMISGKPGRALTQQEREAVNG